MGRILDYNDLRKKSDRQNLNDDFSPNKKLQCPYCGSTAIEKIQFDPVTTQSIPDYRFKCHNCGKVF